jgi:hypothetical protein
MNTYRILKQLNIELRKSDEEQSDSQYQTCWQLSGRLAQAIESDLKKIAGGQPRVFRIGFKLNNSDHQGADTCEASIRYNEYDDFEVAIECLINHDIAKVIVRKRPRSAELEPIANILDKGEYTPLNKYETEES